MTRFAIPDGMQQPSRAATMVRLQLDERQWKKLEAIWLAIEADPSTEITVDVERLCVEVPAAGIAHAFPMDPQTQHRFLNGLDDVGITLTHVDEITTFEQHRPAWLR